MKKNIITIANNGKRAYQHPTMREHELQLEHTLFEVSVDEIASYMNINGSDEKSRKNAVYAYIAKLRKCIDSCSNIACHN